MVVLQCKKPGAVAGIGGLDKLGAYVAAATTTAGSDDWLKVQLVDAKRQLVFILARKCNSCSMADWPHESVSS